jgi:glycosyltransferase involved in cell wall biosynthesis
MKIPLASFVIPVFNGELFLAETIVSCLTQTEQNIEIVVVDDGSTDTTDRILRHFQGADERVRVIKHEHNAGRSAARNTGIRQAQSPVILILDADDIAMPDRVRLTLHHFKKNAGDDIVYGDFQVMDDWGRVQGGVKADAFDSERVKKTLLTYICHGTMAARKSVFEKVEYSDGDWSKHGIDDWKFQMDCVRAGFRLGFIQEPLIQYRVIQKARDEKAIETLKREYLAI